MTQIMGRKLPGPEIMGPVFLYHLKQGIPVTRISVLLTHLNVHYIWSSDTKLGKRLRKQYPLEMTFSRLGAEPELIDCRQFKVPWNVSIPPRKQPAPHRFGPVDQQAFSEGIDQELASDDQSE
jgi:hypothetical protein